MNEDEKKVQEEQEEATQTTVEETVETAEAEETAQVEQEEQAPVEEATQQKEEAPQDSEKYYDDINYQQKEVSEEVKAKTRGILREVLDWVVCFPLAFIVY